MAQKTFLIYNKDTSRVLPMKVEVKVIKRNKDEVEYSYIHPFTKKVCINKLPPMRFDAIK